MSSKYASNFSISWSRNFVFLISASAAAEVAAAASALLCTADEVASSSYGRSLAGHGLRHRVKRTCWMRSVMVRIRFSKAF